MKKRFQQTSLFSILFLTITVPALAADFCSSLANRYDPEIIRLFVRNAEVKIEDQNYLRNITDSLIHDFSPWFESKSPVSYQDMLVQQHQTVMLGLDRKTHYVSPQRSRKNVSVNPLAGGVFRTSPDIRARFSPELTCRRYKCPNNFQDQIIKFFMANQTKTKIEGIDDSYLSSWQVLAPDPSVASQASIRFNYPNPGPALDAHLKRMAQLMEQLRSLPRHSKLNDFIKTLADYVQVFAVALPFDNVNFSVAMAQANYILRWHGYRGIEHGALDFMAMVYPSVEFRDTFRKAVEKAQTKD